MKRDRSSAASAICSTEIAEHHERIAAGPARARRSFSGATPMPSVILDGAHCEELLSDIARAVGFGELFDDAVGLTTA